MARVWRGFSSHAFSISRANSESGGKPGAEDVIDRPWGGGGIFLEMRKTRRDFFQPSEAKAPRSEIEGVWQGVIAWHVCCAFTTVEDPRMDKKSLKRLAEKLHRRRKVYLREFKETETGLRFVAEDRESELEESAQGERTARFLSHLDDRTIQDVAEIDAALERIEAGNYGRCQACGNPIRVARLRLLPATRYCVTCAGRREKAAPEARAEIIHTVEPPGDLGLLTDGELEAQIHERLKEDGRIDAEELRIVCREGVVYLYGALPSEKEHQMLLEIVTDVLGLKEVVDRTGVDEILWEREERSKRERTAKTLPWEEPQGTEDIVEMAEEGKEFSPPDRPTPEEE